MKLNRKNIICYSYILIILINIISSCYLYLFMEKYVYQVIASNENLSVSKNSISSGDIDMNKFENIIQKIEKKSKQNNIENINNIF